MMSEQPELYLRAYLYLMLKRLGGSVHFTIEEIGEIASDELDGDVAVYQDSEGLLLVLEKEPPPIFQGQPLSSWSMLKPPSQEGT